MKRDVSSWNYQQKRLREALKNPADHDTALELFLGQRAAVHHSAVSDSSDSEDGTFADAIWADLTDAIFRRIPHNEEHSIAWVIWHTARIEDMTMNLLVADAPQLWHAQDWSERSGIHIQHSGNAMSAAEIAALSAACDMEAVRAYRVAVGRKTREIVGQLEPGAVNQKVEPARIQRVWDEDAVLEAARGIVEYWSKRTIAGLLLMPATRHNMTHLNEALRLKKKRR